MYNVLKGSLASCILAITKHKNQKDENICIKAQASKQPESVQALFFSTKSSKCRFHSIIF